MTRRAAVTAQGPDALDFNRSFLITANAAGTSEATTGFVPFKK